MTKHIPVPDDLLRFLNGESDLDGVWFGEWSSKHVGQFWWRKHIQDLLDGPGVEPVGEFVKCIDSDYPMLEWAASYTPKFGDRLYLASPSAPVQAVPDGWQWVPKEPTWEMQGAPEVRIGAPCIGCGDTLVGPLDCSEIYLAMLAAAPQPPVSASEWQPIETAPKDGTQILALTKGGDIYAVSYDDIFSAPWRLINEFGFNEHVMTHWMPLPQPPATTDKENGE